MPPKLGLVPPLRLSSHQVRPCAKKTKSPSSRLTPSVSALLSGGARAEPASAAASVQEVGLSPHQEPALRGKISLTKDCTLASLCLSPHALGRLTFLIAARSVALSPYAPLLCAMCSVLLPFVFCSCYARSLCCRSRHFPRRPAGPLARHPAGFVQAAPVSKGSMHV